MKPTVYHLATHIMEICWAHKIVVTWCDRPSRACAMPDHWEICIPAVRSTLSYATALHEIGHLLGQYQQTRFVVAAERWAWVWARDNALIWTDRMDRCAGASLDGYRQLSWTTTAHMRCYDNLWKGTSSPPRSKSKRAPHVQTIAGG